MYCPECGGEYREGFTECADCGVPLVDAPPAAVLHPDVNLVTVWEESDPTKVAMAESLLMEEKIPYVKKGDQIQDFVGIRIAGFNQIAGPVQLLVAEEHAETVLELLQDLKEAEPEPLTEPD